MSIRQYELSFVIKNLIEKNSKNELSIKDIDFQFSALIDKIQDNFLESLHSNDFSIFFDYISESIKAEHQLRIKYAFEKQRLYSATNIYSLGLLITKINVIHTKIISLVVDEIFLLYSDYAELYRIQDFEIAWKLKIQAINLANIFILYLTDNRFIDEQLYDKYIKLISQALYIFK